MVKATVNSIIKSSWPSLVIILTIVVLLRIVYINQKGRKFVLYEELLNLVFITYILLLFELVTSRDVNFSGTNWMPFREIFRYDFGTTGFYRQVVGNIILFIPFGFFATRYTGMNRLGQITLVSFLTSSTIEVVQYFIGRSFDVDDILLNVIGGICGFLLFIALDAIRKKLPKIFQKESFYNILTLLLAIFVVLYLLGFIKVAW